MSGRGRWNRDVYSPEIIAFMKANSPDMKMIELCDAVNEIFGKNYTYDQIKGFVYRNGLKFIKNVRHNLLLTDEQAEYLISIIPGRKSDEVRQMMNEKYDLNLTLAQIRAWKKNHKTPSGYDTRWRKGQESWNKGRKGIHGSNAGTFKKGHESFNKVPIGTVVKRKSTKNGAYYLWIKTRDGNLNNNFEPLHHYVWEQANGPVPDGYVLVFRDGNPENCDLSNLKPVLKAVHVIACTKFGYAPDADVNEAILNTAELMHLYSKRGKKENSHAN